MPIRILSAQLANQIAAGEVVERPASVVKELVENSLDAGADTIDIDIDKGGSKLIRVRDNGSGIANQELVLALSRHATSKIADLDDLEAITSLGFRGEALASISSVSRLTLTSKTEDQSAAWQASASGRDMQVDIKPAAHPVGTTIEVADLFFNTPARRKFLRTDKTEFSHIDELIKRLALSRYDVNWQLNHNGQSVRRLKAANTDEQRQKRVATLCGKAFAENAAYIENRYGDVRIWGWIVHPFACSAQLQCQYSYVNGRMMRDKLLNHAIRQAYGDSLMADQQPAFVLYLEVDPRQVDVNVHPAKHEVRFHQARLIHDFVVSALSDAIEQLNSEPYTHVETSHVHANPVSNSYTLNEVREPNATSTYKAASANAYEPRALASASKQELSYWQSRHTSAYEALNQNAKANDVVSTHYLSNDAQIDVPKADVATTTYLVVKNRYLLYPFEGQVLLIDAVQSFSRYVAAYPQSAAAILLPLRLSVSDEQRQPLIALANDFNQAGFDLLLTNNTVIVRGVPVWTKHALLSKWLPLWFDKLTKSHTEDVVGSFLSILLDAHEISIDNVLNSDHPLLTMPEYWVSAPLQLDTTMQLLTREQQ